MPPETMEIDKYSRQVTGFTKKKIICFPLSSWKVELHSLELLIRQCKNELYTCLNSMFRYETIFSYCRTTRINSIIDLILNLLLLFPIIYIFME